MVRIEIISPQLLTFVLRRLLHAATAHALGLPTFLPPLHLRGWPTLGPILLVAALTMSPLPLPPCPRQCC